MIRVLGILLAVAAACGGTKASEPEAAAPVSSLPANEAPSEPEPPPPIDAAPIDAPLFDPIGVPECDELIAYYLKCDALPAQSRDAFLQGAESWRKAIADGGPETMRAMGAACRQALDAAKQALKQMCPDVFDTP